MATASTGQDRNLAGHGSIPPNDRQEAVQLPQVLGIGERQAFDGLRSHRIGIIDELLHG
jgi:hypothetical protein